MAKGPDFIGKWLKLLEQKNRKIRRAIPHLTKVIPRTVVLPEPVDCTFEVIEDGNTYPCKAKLTSGQCRRLQTVAPDYKGVRIELETLVSEINTRVQQSLDLLESFFQVLGRPVGDPPATGACKYDTDGCALNQSQTDCEVTIGGRWMGAGSTDCTGIPPFSTKKREGRKAASSPRGSVGG